MPFKRHCCRKLATIAQNDEHNMDPGTGLPDYCWHVIPKPEKCTKSIRNVPNGHEISQMSLKYSKWP
jgi:hypothetical protein